MLQLLCKYLTKNRCSLVVIIVFYEFNELLKLSLLFGDGMVLKIQTKDNINYQFGMQLNPEWTEQQILPLNLEKTKIKYSPFSIIVRLIAIGYLIFWIYNRFLRH